MTALPARDLRCSSAIHRQAQDVIRASIDPNEAKRLGDQLGGMLFGR